MLKKEYRLSAYFFKNNARKRVRYAKLIQTPIFSAYAYQTGETFSRFAVIVKNALCRTIVERNKLRRMIYSQLAAQNAPHVFPKYDYVFVVKKTFSSEELEENFSVLIKSLSNHS